MMLLIFRVFWKMKKFRSLLMLRFFLCIKNMLLLMMILFRSIFLILSSMIKFLRMEVFKILIRMR